MKNTQGARVFHALRRRPMTYGDMLDIGAGLSPWKRCVEYIKHHASDWTVVRTVGKRDGLVRWSVVRARGV